MPIYFLIGLTILILVIAVYATVAEEEDESTSVENGPAPERKPESYQEPYHYRKAS